MRLLSPNIGPPPPPRLPPLLPAGTWMLLPPEAEAEAEGPPPPTE